MDDDVLELDEEEWVPVPIDSLTVKELKDELGSRGLRKGGTRDILIDRLVDALNGTKTLPRPEDPLDSEEVVPEALPVSFEQALGDTLAENLLLVSGGLDGCPSSLPVEMQPPHIRPRDEPTVRVIDYDPHLLALHKPSGLPGEEDNTEFTHFVETWLQDWVGDMEETVTAVNVIMLNPNTCCTVNATAELKQFMKKHGIDCVDVPNRHRYILDSGLHCKTLDLKRKS